MKHVYFLLETTIMFAVLVVFFEIFAITSMREGEGIIFYFMYLTDVLAIFISISRLYKKINRKNILSLILTISAWITIVFIFGRL